MKQYEITIDDMETAFLLFEFATSRVVSRGETLNYENVYDELYRLHNGYDIEEVQDLFNAWYHDPMNRDGYDEIEHDCHSSAEDGCQVCDVE